MITRDNFKDILKLIDDTDKQRILNYDHEYVMIDAYFSNAGAVVSIDLLNDLPLDYDDLVSTGSVVFLETGEVASILNSLT